MSRVHPALAVLLLAAGCAIRPAPPAPRDTAAAVEAAPAAPSTPADTRRWVVTDFDDLAHEQPVDFPLWRTGLVFDVQGGERPYAVDVTQRMVVRGPHSVGLPTHARGAMLSVMTEQPARAIWVSLIHDGPATVSTERLNADGTSSTESLSFSQSETEGAYRTFSLDGRQTLLRGVRFVSGGAVFAQAAAVLE